MMQSRKFILRFWWKLKRTFFWYFPKFQGEVHFCSKCFLPWNFKRRPVLILSKSENTFSRYYFHGTSPNHSSPYSEAHSFCSTDAANSVQVVCLIVGHCDVYHIGNALNIDTTGGYVCTNQETNFSVFELFQVCFSLLSATIGVEARRTLEASSDS